MNSEDSVVVEESDVIEAPGEEKVVTEPRPKVSWGEVVRVGGKKFEVDPELAEALRSQAQEQQRQRDAEIQGYERKASEELKAELAKLRGGEPEAKDAFDVEAFWQNPGDVLQGMLTKMREEITAELTGQYQNAQNFEKIMIKFYEDNPELQNYKELVDYVASKYGSELRGILDQQQRMDELANLTSKLVMQIRGDRSEGKGPRVEGGAEVVRMGMKVPRDSEKDEGSEVPESLTAALKMSRKKRSGIAKSLGL